MLETFDNLNSPAVKVRALCKRYGAVTAVDHLDLEIGPGQICALLGPNGAGKTTVILMLLGLTAITSGTAEALGFDPMEKPLEIRRRVGYLPENVGFYGELSAGENLAFVARLNGLEGREALKAVRENLEIVGLAEVADRKTAAFSRGMRQRLGLAEVLIKKPRLMILDEPTLGLDPEGIDEMLNLIVSLAAERGLTVLVSSHLLHLVERVAHRVAILKKGRLLAAGTVAELARTASPGGGLAEVYRYYFHQGEED